MTDSTLTLRGASADSSSGDESWLTSLADWTVSLMEIIGPIGAGLAIALENLFPPLPSEVVLPMAGLTASRGSFTLFEALLWTTLGSVVGAFALYGLGRWLGAARLRAIAAKVPLLHPEDVDRTVAWFERHGGKAVFFGRMVPIFRSLIWNTIFVLAGYLLGENWHVIEQYADVLKYVVIVGVTVGVAWFFYVRVRSLLASRRDA